MNVTREQVMSVLDEVYDPCSQAWQRPLSLVDLGLVREVTVEGDRVGVRISLTAPYCMAVATIMRAVERRVAELPGVADVRVEIDPVTPWSAELMTDRGRLRLVARRATDRATVGPAGTEQGG